MSVLDRLHPKALGVFLAPIAQPGSSIAPALSFATRLCYAISLALLQLSEDAFHAIEPVFFQSILSVRATPISRFVLSNSWRPLFVILPEPIAASQLSLLLQMALDVSQMSVCSMVRVKQAPPTSIEALQAFACLETTVSLAAFISFATPSIQATLETEFCNAITQRLRQFESCGSSSLVVEAIAQLVSGIDAAWQQAGTLCATWGLERINPDPQSRSERDSFDARAEKLHPGVVLLSAALGNRRLWSNGSLVHQLEQHSTSALLTRLIPLILTVADIVDKCSESCRVVTAPAVGKLCAVTCSILSQQHVAQLADRISNWCARDPSLGPSCACFFSAISALEISEVNLEPLTRSINCYLAVMEKTPCSEVSGCLVLSSLLQLARNSPLFTPRMLTDCTGLKHNLKDLLSREPTKFEDKNWGSWNALEKTRKRKADAISVAIQLPLPSGITVTTTEGTNYDACDPAAALARTITTAHRSLTQLLSPPHQLMAAAHLADHDMRLLARLVSDLNHAQKRLRDLGHVQ
eukprot:c10756_g1_i2.p1 GENE.c10756_g1_i2~~c10756_g1_i2.p1  ORF type:complete len:524 (-),score=135.98 c10756_g1_i2:6-1577(-)